MFKPTLHPHRACVLLVDLATRLGVALDVLFIFFFAEHFDILKHFRSFGVFRLHGHQVATSSLFLCVGERRATKDEPVVTLGQAGSISVQHVLGPTGLRPGCSFTLPLIFEALIFTVLSPRASIPAFSMRRKTSSCETQQPRRKRRSRLNTERG